jgi:hypothetical protein
MTARAHIRRLGSEIKPFKRCASIATLQLEPIQEGTAIASAWGTASGARRASR